MNNKSFTIHTQLIDGDLNGARNIYMGASKTCHLYVLPRNRIELANTEKNICKQPAFYILIGEENGKFKGYIGQTTDFSDRKNEHYKRKEWWDKALVFISDNHQIFGDDIKFLEYLGVKTAIEAGSYTLINGNSPKMPRIASDRINDMENFFNDIVLLTEFYGCGIFNPPKASVEVERHIFYIKTKGKKLPPERQCEASGYWNSQTNKFILLKGSKLASETVESYKRKEKHRQEFISNYCKIDNGEIILQEDREFPSVSGASDYVLGRSSSGTTNWKDSEGLEIGKYLEDLALQG